MKTQITTAILAAACLFASFSMQAADSPEPEKRVKTIAVVNQGLVPKVRLGCDGKKEKFGAETRDRMRVHKGISYIADNSSDGGGAAIFLAPLVVVDFVGAAATTAVTYDYSRRGRPGDLREEILAVIDVVAFQDRLRTNVCAHLARKSSWNVTAPGQARPDYAYQRVTRASLAKEATDVVLELELLNVDLKNLKNRGSRVGLEAVVLLKAVNVNTGEKLFSRSVYWRSEKAHFLKTWARKDAAKLTAEWARCEEELAGRIADKIMKCRPSMKIGQESPVRSDLASAQ